MNPRQPRHLDRLRQAMKAARSEMEPYRNNRYKAIQEYVGNHFSSNGADERVPLGLIELAVCVYTYQLSARRPRAACSTPHTSLKQTAAMFEMALNRALEVIELQEALQDCVLSSLFGLGVLKVGLCDGSGEQDRLRMAGQPFASNVDLDDFVLDMVHAKHLNQCQFMGDRYQVDYDWMQNCGLYDKAAMNFITPQNDRSTNEEGDRRASAIGSNGGASMFNDPYAQTVELWDIWLPFEKLLVTLPAGNDGPPIRVVEWNGPDNGPYYLLHYNKVPGNVMPLPPVGMWMDLHKIANTLYLKASQQAERQKDITTVADGAEEDARRMEDAKDGDYVAVQRNEAIVERSTAGANPKTMGMATMTKDLAIYFMGNLDTLGGLAPQSGTLGQDKLLSENASRRIQFMQDRMYSLTDKVINGIGQYIWNDPYVQIPLAYRVPGTEYEVELAWTPEMRRGDYLAYNISTIPHSMQYVSPSQKLQTIQGLWTGFVAPMLPMMQQQGIMPNFQGLMRQIFRLGNVSAEMEDMFQFAAPMDPTTSMGPIGQPPQKMGAQQPQGFGVAGTPGPQDTSTQTRSGQDRNMASILMGMDEGIQPSQSQFGGG